MKTPSTQTLSFIDGDLFTWDSWPNGAVGSTNATTIGLPTHGFMPETVAVRSHRTNRIKLFDFTCIGGRDDEDETTAVYTERNPVDPSKPIVLHVYQA